jgi:hypothetical protein
VSIVSLLPLIVPLLPYSGTRFRIQCTNSRLLPVPIIGPWERSEER